MEPSTPRARRVQDVAAAADADAGTATPVSGRGGRSAGASGSKATPSSLGKRSRAAAQSVSNLPRFTMPLIKHVCEVQGTPRAATHVYAGVESVYRSLQTAQEELEASAPGTPSKRRRSNDGGQAEGVVPAALPVPTDDQVPALAAAVHLMTASSMRGEKSFEAGDEQKRAVQSAVEAYFAKVKTATTSINSTSLQHDIETYYTQAAKSGWSDMEWYRNLPSNNETTNRAEGDENNGLVTPRRQPAKTPLRRREKHSQRKIGDEDVYGAAGLLPGLGTMFQPAVDWLREDRREDFAVWKQDLLTSVEAIEQRG